MRSMPLNVSTVKLEVAGSNTFGRYPKMSAQKTFNMYLTDDNWMVSTPGYRKILEIDPLAEGRDVFTSARGKFMIVVLGNGVWKVDASIKKIDREIPIGIDSAFFASKIGELETATGDVFIDENDAEQIGICDLKNIYMYNYQYNTFQIALTPGSTTLDFRPGYITFQDNRFISCDLDKPNWRLSEFPREKGQGGGLVWPADTQHVGEFQTKPDNVKACVRVPGKGGQLFVMGSTVTEAWNDVGYKLFPYYRTNSFNIDYGCINQATIAASDTFIVWLGVNEKSSPVILASTGGPPTQISTDGINYDLARLQYPEDSYGFLWKSDGHLFYQLTLVRDNVTYLYDFNTKRFYYLTDRYLQHPHIAKRITFFENDYYFVSLIDGDLYRLSSDITNYDGQLIPRVRVANTIRDVKSDRFIARKMGFTLEQGGTVGTSRIDVSLSADGGESFGNYVSYDLNPLGQRQNVFNVYGMGLYNEFTPQFRFWGDSRFLCADGYVEIYK